MAPLSRQVTHSAASCSVAPTARVARSAPTFTSCRGLPGSAKPHGFHVQPMSSGSPTTLGRRATVVMRHAARSLGFNESSPEEQRMPYGIHLSPKEMESFFEMTRPHNLIPSMILVFLGAWAGTGRDLSAFMSPLVWVMAFCSAGVTSASMVINDYFDFRSGVDGVNTPYKPLPAGRVAPDLAVLFSGCVYVAVLMAACLMPSPALRCIVALSAGGTLLYTPLFKRFTVLKNAVVASIIAVTPLCGALAAGVEWGRLGGMITCTFFAFTSVMYREILMDITDVKGDSAAGVSTLPVRLGRERALAVAASLSLAGSLVSLGGLLTPGGPLSLTLQCASHATTLWGALQTMLVPQAGCFLLVLMSAWQLLSHAYKVHAAGYDQAVLDAAVSDCRGSIGMAVILLAATAR